MEPIITQIHNALLKKQSTIAVAESCTGGLLSKSLTDMPGSSSYFMVGIVAYSNKAKQRILFIPALTLRRFGAVSKPVAVLMAVGAKKIGHSDYGVGITGIAGPAGGTKEKPVGTVFIAVANKTTVRCKKFIFQGTRGKIRSRAAQSALLILKNMLR